MTHPELPLYSPPYLSHPEKVLKPRSSLAKELIEGNLPSRMLDIKSGQCSYEQTARIVDNKFTVYQVQVFYHVS